MLFDVVYTVSQRAATVLPKLVLYSLHTVRDSSTVLVDT
jgi:hypothetical protein